jgi:hypothetical protein
MNPAKVHAPTIRVFVATSFATILLLGAGVYTLAQVTGAVSTRISQNIEGVGQLGNAGQPSLSANGKIFAFSSTAENLVANDTNNRSDIFVGAVGTPGLKRISVGRFGVQGNGGSFNPSVSPQAPNGFVAVAFASDANNIGRALNRFPDNNGERDIYYSLPNRKNFTRRVSYGVGGIAANGPSRNPSITILPEPNRLVVAYHSIASNLISNDTNDVADVFLTTISKAEDSVDDDDSSNTVASGFTTVRISTPNDPALESNGPSAVAQVSGSGDFVVFESTATNLVSGAIPTAKQIYIKNLKTGTTELISRASDGTPGNADSFNPTISYQGTFVAYSTQATNVLNDGKSPPIGALQIVLYNRVNKRSIRINTSSSGEPGNGPLPPTTNSAISPTGRLVFFSDLATNLVPNDSNNTIDVFVRDTINLTTSRVSSGFDSSEANGPSLSVSLGQGSFSSLSTLSSFLSSASNIVPNDVEGNEDVFTSTFDIPKPILSRGTVLEVPPDVTPSVSRATIGMQTFTVKRARSTVTRASSSSKKSVVQYVVTLSKENPSGKLVEVMRKTATRANVTFKNLPPGTYVSKYRTQVQTGSTISNKSKSSPPIRFAVGTPTPVPVDE